MAPSRGHQASPAASSSTTSHTSGAKSDDDAAVNLQSSSALASARRNFSFLISPSSSNQPARIRTRALLRSVRYITQFILWRVVRWAKYAAIAALSATVIGSVVSGVAWIAAPTGIGASIAAATVWGVGKFIARRMQARWERRGGMKGQKDRERAEEMEMRSESERVRKVERDGAGLKGMPW